MALYRLELGFNVSNPGQPVNGKYQLDAELYVDAAGQVTTFLAQHFEEGDQFYIRLFRSGGSSSDPGDLGLNFTLKTIGPTLNSPIQDETGESNLRLPLDDVDGNVHSSLFDQALPCWVLAGGSGDVGKKLTLVATPNEIKWAVNFQVVAGGFTFSLDPEMIIDPNNEPDPC